MKMEEVRRSLSTVSYHFENLNGVGSVSEEDWESLKGALVNILDYAAGFYDMITATTNVRFPLLSTS